jgi:hypothetical protein
MYYRPYLADNYFSDAQKETFSIQKLGQLSREMAVTIMLRYVLLNNKTMRKPYI